MGWVDHKDRFKDATIELDLEPDRVHPRHYRPVAILIVCDSTFWEAAMEITKWVDTEPNLRWVRSALGYREQTTFARQRGWSEAWVLVRDSLENLRRARRGM